MAAAVAYLWAADRFFFWPQAEIIILRRYLRHRETLVRGAATCIQRIQKALTEKVGLIAMPIALLASVLAMVQ